MYATGIVGEETTMTASDFRKAVSNMKHLEGTIEGIIKRDYSLMKTQARRTCYFK